jgi:hypothetical protein
MSLSAQQVQAAISYNKQHLVRGVPLIRKALELPDGPIDAAFVEGVYQFQTLFFRGDASKCDGKLGPLTEASLNIQHPRAIDASANAMNAWAANFILFDSWGNDLRDNNVDGNVDDDREQTDDGAHYAGTYPAFSVVAGTYDSLGWGKNKTYTVRESKTVTGPFRYRVCADVVSQCYADAGIMRHTRSTAGIMAAFREKGYLFRLSEGFPNAFLPGDFIATYGDGHGHTGIVIEASLRKNGWPTVVELPGPSTTVDLNEYNPIQTNDVRKGIWSKSYMNIADKSHYLGRLLLSKVAP